MKPILKLEDGTLIVTAAVGAVTSTGEIRTQGNDSEQTRTTRILSHSGAVLYEAETIVPTKHTELISDVANRHRAIVAAVEAAFS